MLCLKHGNCVFVVLLVELHTADEGGSFFFGQVARAWQCEFVVVKEQGSGRVAVMLVLKSC